MPDLHPVVDRVLAGRGLDEPAELRLELAGLLPGDSLGGLSEAAVLLADAVQRDQRILIVGDYDADGATGTALAVSVLREFGARQVDFLVPDRVRLGYGLTPGLATEALAREPALVVTVDNGISSVRGVADLRRAGVRVLVTDHHLPGPELPDADVIVNPNQPGDAFPSKALAGVGVMFYTLAATRAELRRRGHFKDTEAPNLALHLDLVALGTVADLVPLDRNNRILVEQGLRRLRSGYARPGLQALIEVSGRKAPRLLASDLGYALGPRLNAAGRLEHMDRGIDCLLAGDRASATALAAELDGINRSRREVQQQMQEEALDSLLRSLRRTRRAHALVVQRKDWHEGVIGLVASRVKEHYHRPCVAFAGSADGELKGSARSISGFHMRDALARIDASHPGLILKFGGHAMAAGLTLKAAGLDRFAAALEQLAADWLRPEQLESVLLSDGPLAAAELRPSTALALNAAGPWGQAFEEPLFDNVFELLDQRIVGGAHLKLKLGMAGLRRPLDAIWFGRDEALRQRQAHFAYRLQLDDYFGDERLQLVIEGMGETPPDGS